MNKVIIISDSTCDLNEKLLKQRDIKILPLKICFEEEIYNDIFDIQTHKMYEMVDEKGILPKTSAITIETFEEEFKKHINDGDDVIFCGIGSKLSSGYDHALIAKNNMSKEEQSHIFVIDSLNLSTGIGLLLLKLCDFRDQGLSAKEIATKGEYIAKCVRSQFSVKNLTYLHKGGRCSGVARFFGTMLRIRPVLRVFDGNILLSEQVYGNYYKSLRLQIEDLVNNIDDIDKDYLFVTVSDSKEIQDYVYDNIPKEILSKFKHVYKTEAGCVVSAHCGKETVGILYIKKNPLISDKQ